MTALVTFGETMLRLSVPRGQRLTRTDRLDLHVGGAESNVAVAAAALGVETAWLSALPETALGERVAHALRGEGVEPAVTWTDTGRVGTYYLERDGPPRGQTVVYDRSGAPLRDVTPEDLSAERVRDADVFFTSGITPALSEQLASTTGELLGAAREAGVSTAFDINYRSKLWTPADARRTVTGLFPDVDILFVPERDVRDVLGYDGNADAVGQALLEEHDFETVVLTQGGDGALAVEDGTVYEQPAFETGTVDPVGSGDAFVGGYLAQRILGGSVPDALAYGAASAALKRTIEGDMAILSPEEVSAIVADDDHSAIDR